MQPSQLNYTQTEDFLTNIDVLDFNYFPDHVSKIPPTERITTFRADTMTTMPILNFQLDVLPMDPDDCPMDIPLTQYRLKVLDIKTLPWMDEMNQIHMNLLGLSPNSSEIYEFSAVFCDSNHHNSLYLLDQLPNMPDPQFSSYYKLTGSVFFATLNLRDNDGYPEYFFDNFEHVSVH
jgi:hypothetical protein